MNNPKFLIRYTWRMFCFILLLSSCKKAEHMPEPMGEPIAPETEVSYIQVLNQPSFSLFRAALERSTFKSELTKREKGIPFTLLAPVDQAFEKEGISLKTIQDMKIEDLDSLVAYHIIDTRIGKTAFSPFMGSVFVNTLLKHANLKASINRKPYVYLHAISMVSDQVIIDGKEAGKENTVLVKYGTVWPVNRVLARPKKFMYDVLRADGRFSIFLKMCEQNDLLYTKNINKIINEDWMGVIDENEFGDYWQDMTEFQLTSDLMSVNKKYNMVNRLTLLAPTDEAFKKAGFQTAAQFAKLNQRSSLKRYIFSYRQYTATDSILINHWFGGRYYVASDVSQVSNPLVFYSQDLNNNVLGQYNVFYEGLNTETGDRDPELIMPLDYIENSGSTIKIRVKGSSNTPASVLDRDINTLNGPIHVVDHLLVPNGFKLTL